MGENFKKLHNKSPSAIVWLIFSTWTKTAAPRKISSAVMPSKPA